MPVLPSFLFVTTAQIVVGSLERDNEPIVLVGTWTKWCIQYCTQSHLKNAPPFPFPKDVKAVSLLLSFADVFPPLTFRLTAVFLNCTYTE